MTKTLAIALLFTLLLSSCCRDEVCRESKGLYRLEQAEAEQEFRRLSADKQVAVISWELSNQKPASSRFDHLLRLDDEETIMLAIAELEMTNNYFVYMTMFHVVLGSDGSRLSRVEIKRVHKALERCESVAGNDTAGCKDLRAKVLKFG